MALAEKDLYSNVNVYLLPEHRRTKPSANEIGKISNQIIRHPVTLSLDELAFQIGECGKTVVPCTLTHSHREQANFESTQLLMIDIDNGHKVNGKKIQFTGDRYLPLSKVMADPFTQTYAAFVYETFSSTEHWNRYRIIFHLDKTITDLNEFQTICEKLTQYYHADTVTQDPTRLFFGGKHVHVINFGNFLNVKNNSWLPIFQYFRGLGLPTVMTNVQNNPVYQGKQDILNSKNPFNSYPETHQNEQVRINSADRKGSQGEALKPFVSNVTDLIRFHKWDELKKAWKDLNLPESCTEESFSQSFVHLSMRKLYGLPLNQRFFMDIFHEENHPSANVYMDEGIYKYHCFSESCLFTGNNIEVFAKLSGLTLDESLEKLSWLTGSRITDGFKDQIQAVQRLLRTMNGKRFKEEYPDSYHYFNPILTDVIRIFELFEKHGSSVWMKGNKISHLFFMSSRTLAADLFGDASKHKRASSLLVLLSYVGLIKQLNDRHLPGWLLSRMQAKQYARHANCYELCRIDDRTLDRIEAKCQKLRDHGICRTAITKEALFHMDGLLPSSQVFIQRKDVARTVSLKSKGYLAAIRTLIDQNLDEFHVAIERTVTDQLMKKKACTQSQAEREMKQARPYLIKRGYTRVRLTKKLKEELGVQDYFKDRATPVIYIK